MAYLTESTEKLVRSPLTAAWKQFLLGVLLRSRSYCQMCLSIVDRFLHHDSGEKQRIRKEKRPRRRVQGNAERLEPECLSRAPSGAPSSAWPSPTWQLFTVSAARPECAHKFLGVYILHTRPSVCCAPWRAVDHWQSQTRRPAPLTVKPGGAWEISSSSR